MKACRIPFPLSAAVAIVALGLVLASAVPAEAAPGWVLGSVERSSVINCPSLISDNPYREVGAIAGAELLVGRRSLPRVGEVFYVRTRPGAVGRPCADQSVAVEVVLPVGVKLAISPGKPVRCSYFDIDSGKVTPVSPAQGCPQRAGPGIFGRSLNRTGAEGPAWTLPYGQGLSIEVPLRSSRQLKGIASQTPSCGRREGEPPCRPEQAGDHLQFAVHVLDGNGSPWLSPYIGLFAQGKPGRCARLKGRRRAACVRRSCARLRGAKRRACVKKVGPQVYRALSPVSLASERSCTTSHSAREATSGSPCSRSD